MKFTNKEKITCPNLKEIAQGALQFINTNKVAYTRQMYIALRIKDKGLSLNKFRKLLQGLNEQQIINFIPAHQDSLPAWGAKKAGEK
ncbi:hypothetical protein [Acinetobacter modestus]|uniref:hypothetical protein n=1 Tax=Acinetobacter modestus TaxID=1776740 RepID=UPI001F4B4AD6|nr:hypothetical protein [Acinetobacter modestus]MCH7333455.1 hypothetical protein [Acinetobacter modestus]